MQAALDAVRTDAADDRRLHLARLRLRQHDLDKAEAGVARIRARTARERGVIMLSLAEVRNGRDDAARRRLASIRSRAWRGVAAVLEARLVLDSGEPEEALEILDRGADALGAYWAGEARRLISELPRETVASWRQHMARRVASSSGRSQERWLGRWGLLETDPVTLEAIRERVAAHHLLRGGPEPGSWEGTLAARLWSVGLESSAVAWDPEGMPTSTPRATWWSAQHFARLGAPWRAVRTADLAWRQVGVHVPLRLVPSDLRHQLHPLPWARQVQRAADAAEVPWSLLAAVAREESRWDPAVVSVVGARGLTQLMPATAAAAAERLGVSSPAVDDLHRPEIGLQLGAAELGRLLRAFANRPSAAVAAYNAGEPQARLWLEQCGAGCSEVEYVLSVSFSSTRGYLTDVLVAAEVYEELYGRPPPAGPGGDGLESGITPSAVIGSGSPPAGWPPAAASARSRR